MAHLKESPKQAEVRALHNELWSKLQDMDEDAAEAYAKRCLDHAGQSEAWILLSRLRVRLSGSCELLTRKSFWISLLGAVLLGPTVLLLLVWAALITE
ncbi:MULTISPECIES: hypothetical protein [Paenibacillus]|uniref:hypothetical protein n=1 Tax=Paenibacillus TaxID=44249 RepID=UPI0022B93B30|nr:hypothetical protein [Paenibacillus caseinilyticus]MCZ8520408.1 hypothetical protein [Paenibacillus caseinilyticus]